MLVHTPRALERFSPLQLLPRRFRGMRRPPVPFANLPEGRTGRWGEGLQRRR